MAILAVVNIVAVGMLAWGFVNVWRMRRENLRRKKWFAEDEARLAAAWQKAWAVWAMRGKELQRRENERRK